MIGMIKKNKTKPGKGELPMIEDKEHDAPEVVTTDLDPDFNDLDPTPGEGEVPPEADYDSEPEDSAPEAATGELDAAGEDSSFVPNGSFCQTCGALLQPVMTACRVCSSENVIPVRIRRDAGPDHPHYVFRFRKAVTTASGGAISAPTSFSK